MSSKLQNLASHIEDKLGDNVSRVWIAFGELNVEAGVGSIVTVLKFLRDDSACEFAQLIDLCGADYPERSRRFEVVYHLLSMTQNQRIRVKLEASEDMLVPSVVDLYDTANWFEREAFDMYGIRFSGHPDLRRLLTDYGFEGYPLRKDFPLTGHVEVRYDDDAKKVVYEPVSLVQEFRDFDFESPWEGAHMRLPGDEKADIATGEE
ncbi:NADH-quinone oxidoreductase subunit C [Alphaproteobacteria bacterium]|nr:NADH-quinone oxidoreductase subunit C [Alphaproteobacteria bacterium]